MTTLESVELSVGNEYFDNKMTAPTASQSNDMHLQAITNKIVTLIATDENN